MFDIGFSEVLLIFVIALVVLGPEKLPRAASQVGRWIGRARAMARQFKEQLEEEVNLENVRKAHKEAAAKEEASSKDRDAAGNTTSGADAGSGVEATASPESGAQAQIEAPAPTTIPPEAYTGPDPTEFRADTFSHAHPTNEYGANPLTPNGAPEELRPPAATETSAVHVSGAAPGYDSSGATHSDESSSANETRATHGEPSAEHAPRANGSDAYVPRTPATGTPTDAPLANEPAREPVATTATQTDNHGHS
jgi:sec-independent protein translocase protein TatB